MAQCRSPFQPQSRGCQAAPPTRRARFWVKERLQPESPGADAVDKHSGAPGIVSSGSFRDALRSSVQGVQRVGAGTEDRPFLTPAVWLLDPSEHTALAPTPRSHLVCFSGMWGWTWLRLQGGLRQCRQCPGLALGSQRVAGGRHGPEDTHVGLRVPISP